MKKFFLIIMGVLLFACSNSKNSESKKENTDSTKVTKNSELTNSETWNGREAYYKEAKKYYDKGKFGHPTVGFINFPKGDWAFFTDLDSEPSSLTLQLSQANVNIYTLDVLQLKDKKGLSDEQIAMEVIKINYQRFYNGKNENDLKIAQITSASGYKGAQLIAKNIEGKTLITNVFVVGNGIYFATVEGLPEVIDEMEKNVLESWNPKFN